MKTLSDYAITLLLQSIMQMFKIYCHFEQLCHPKLIGVKHHRQPSIGRCAQTTKNLYSNPISFASSKISAGIASNFSSSL
jgi:hypothetical protein